LYQFKKGIASALTC